MIIMTFFPTPNQTENCLSMFFQSSFHIFFVCDTFCFLIMHIKTVIFNNERNLKLNAASVDIVTTEWNKLVMSRLMLSTVYIGCNLLSSVNK